MIIVEDVMNIKNTLSCIVITGLTLCTISATNPIACSKPVAITHNLFAWNYEIGDIFETKTITFNGKSKKIAEHYNTNPLFLDVKLIYINTEGKYDDLGTIGNPITAQDPQCKKHPELSKLIAMDSIQDFFGNGPMFLIALHFKGGFWCEDKNAFVICHQ